MDDFSNKLHIWKKKVWCFNVVTERKVSTTLKTRWFIKKMQCAYNKQMKNRKLQMQGFSKSNT